MGLDMLPLARPHVGHELEFTELWTQFQILNGNLPQKNPTLPKFLWQKVFGVPATNCTPNELAHAIKEISDEAFTVLEAPIVGTDKIANDWLDGKIAQGDFGTNADTIMVHKQMHGYYVMELLPDCDGFPVYSNHFLSGAKVDRTSFRGNFLDDCTEVLDKVDIDLAWVPKLAPDLLVYGEELRSSAERAAKKQNLCDLIGQNVVPDAPDGSISSQVHITDSCGRWCIYWAERGHGLSPDY